MKCAKSGTEERIESIKEVENARESDTKEIGKVNMIMEKKNFWSSMSKLKMKYEAKHWPWTRGVNNDVFDCHHNMDQSEKGIFDVKNTENLADMFTKNISEKYGKFNAKIGVEYKGNENEGNQGSN